MIDASQRTHAFTLDIWIKPPDTQLVGSAPIVTLAKGLEQRNFTLAQSLQPDGILSQYATRIRTTGTGLSGSPSMSAGAVASTLTHIIYTHAESGQRRLFIDGQEVASDELGGDFTNWDPTHSLALANEITGERSWVGEFYRVAVYNCAFSAAEVAKQFEDAPQTGTGPAQPL